MKILVCGGRDFNDWDAICWALDPYDNAEENCIIHGDANGADQLAKAWAVERGICHIPVAPNWDYYGKPAGPIRNGWMLKFCQPDLVIAFPGGRGTHNMCVQAEAAGVEVIDIKK